MTDKYFERNKEGEITFLREGLTSTIMEPIRGACALPYPASFIQANHQTIAFVDQVGQNGSGKFYLRDGDATLSAGQVPANTAYWLYGMGLQVEQLLPTDDPTVYANGPIVSPTLAVEIMKNCRVTVNLESQEYDFGNAADWLLPVGGSTTAQSSRQEFIRKFGWPGLADGKVPFAVNPGNVFKLRLKTISEHTLSTVAEPALDYLFLVRVVYQGVTWLADGAAFKK